MNGLNGNDFSFRDIPLANHVTLEVDFPIRNEYDRL